MTVTKGQDGKIYNPGPKKFAQMASTKQAMETYPWLVFPGEIFRMFYSKNPTTALRNTVVKNWKTLLVILSLFFTMNQSSAAPVIDNDFQWIPLRKEASPWVSLTYSPETLLKKADEEISNFHLSAARGYLNRVLKENNNDNRARELLSFVDFLEGKKPKIFANELGSLSAKLPMNNSPLTANSSYQALLEKADEEVSNLNLSSARIHLEMALKKKPNDIKASELLSLVDFLEKKEQKIFKNNNFSNKGKASSGKPQIESYTGYFFRESDSGITEKTAILETTFDKLRWTTISGGFFLESRGYEDNNQEANSKVIGARLNYSPTSSNRICFSISPEIFDNNKTVNQYGLSFSSKFKGYKFEFASEKNTLRDSLSSIQNRMEEKDLNFYISKKLSKTVELRQGLLWSSISDGNSSLSFNSKLKYRFHPGWTLDLKFFKAGYDSQADENGDYLNYWSPKNYRLVVLALDWKKRLTPKWKCEVETSLSGSATEATEDSDENYNAGVGILLHAGYRLSSGDIGLSYAHKIYLNSLEKRLNLEGNLIF